MQPKITLENVELSLEEATWLADFINRHQCTYALIKVKLPQSPPEVSHYECGPSIPGIKSNLSVDPAWNLADILKDSNGDYSWYNTKLKTAEDDKGIEADEAVIR